MTEAGATILTAYPVSGAFLSRLEPLLGGAPRVIVLSELKRGSLLRTLGVLGGVRGRAAYAVTEDESARALLPLLRLALSLSRARRLATVSPELRVEPFGRGAATIEALRLAWASLAGIAALVLCHLELLMLRRRKRVPVVRTGIRSLAYLKTTLWLGVKAGGSIGHVAGVANAFARRLHRVCLLAPDRPPLLEPAVAVTLIAPQRAPAFPYELNHYRYQRRFTRLALRNLRQEAPDVVYQRLSLASYAGAVLSEHLRVPLVVEYNGSEAWVARNWGLGLRFPRTAALAEDVLLSQADVVATVSDVLRDELLARGIPPSRIVTYPNGIDPSRFDPARFDARSVAAIRAAHGISSDAVVCGFIGTFGQWHGVLVLAEAIRRLAERHRAWLTERRAHFLIMGDGMLMPEVRRMLQGEEVAAFVTLTGLLPQDQAPGHLAACDVLLSPHVPNADGTRFFGSPTKLFEYMCIERAIVASRLEQIGEILQPALSPADASLAPDESDAVAMTVSPGDVEDLIAGIRVVVDRPALARRLAANARRLVLSRYTWEHHVNAISDALERAFGAR
jgi:glycosyltransferase involved in cell wall biosynthesis